MSSTPRGSPLDTAPAGPVALRIAAGQKVFIAGQNRSGKSTLATSIARRLDRVVVYDPKDDPAAELTGAAVLGTAHDVVRALPGRIVYRPHGRELADVVKRWDEICGKILRDARTGRGATAILVHELGDLGGSVTIGPKHSELIRQGGSLGITVIEVTQRPVGVPVLARTEAQHVACFALLAQADRDTMAELMEPEQRGLVRSRMLPLDHTWWYRGPDLRLVLCSPVAMR